MTTQPNPSDEFLWYEYLQSDLFWIIAIAILLNYAISSQQIDPENIIRGRIISSQPRTGPPEPRSPLSMCHQQLELVEEILKRPRELGSLLSFKDSIRSRFHQYLSLLFFISPLPIQSIYGSYVFKTMWRLSYLLIKSTYPDSIRPRLLGIILFSPIGSLILAAWLMVITVGATVIGTQIALCAEVWRLEPNARPAVRSVREEAV